MGGDQNPQGRDPGRRVLPPGQLLHVTQDAALVAARIQELTITVSELVNVTQRLWQQLGYIGNSIKEASRGTE